MFNAKGPYKAIPAKKWKNTRTGRTASVTGAVPWTSDDEKDDWQVVTVGWTVESANGIRGMGRKPMSKEEAEALAERLS